VISLVFRVYRAGVNGTPGSPGFDITKPRTPGLKNETRVESLVTTTGCVLFGLPAKLTFVGLGVDRMVEVYGFQSGCV